MVQYRKHPFLGDLGMLIKAGHGSLFSWHDTRPCDRFACSEKRRDRSKGASPAWRPAESVDVHVVSLSEKLPLASDPIPVQLAAAESPDSGWDRPTMAFPRLHEIHGVPVPPSSPDYRTLPARVLFSLHKERRRPRGADC